MLHYRGDGDGNGMPSQPQPQVKRLAFAFFFVSFWLCEKIYICVYPQLDQQIYSALVFYMFTAHGVTVSVSTRTLKNDVILGLIKTKSF